MSRKNLKFNIFLFACLALSLLSWGISIHKGAHLSETYRELETIERAYQEPVKSEVSREKSVIPVAGNEEEYAATEEEESGENKTLTLVEHLGAPDIAISQAAADELAKIGEPAVASLLSKLRESTDVGMRGEIIFLLGRIASKEAVGDLLAMLNDENAYIRRNAAEALGKIKDERASNDLARSLFDEDISVRERAARSLGEINSSGAGTSIIERMEGEKEERVKSAMVEAIGEIKDQSATLALVNELKTENDQMYKNKVAFSLGELKNPQALQDLNDYLNKLKTYNPTVPMVVFQWKESIRIAEEAITKIQAIN